MGRTAVATIIAVLSAAPIIGRGPSVAPSGNASVSNAVDIQLLAAAGSSVGQGMPFAFQASARNSGPEARDVFVLFLLRPAESEAPPVAITSWDVSVPGGSTVSAEFGAVTSQWFADEGSFSITASIRGQQAGRPLRFEVVPPSVTPPLFQDVTTESGIRSNVGGAACNRYGNGAAWGDVNGDGDLDLYVPQHHRRSQLWINDGSGHFMDEAALRGVLDEGSIGMGAAFADYDNDGDPDLYVVNDGPNRLYGNDGTGFFQDVTEAAGVGDDGAGPSASWGDYDADGLLDLYVTNYRSCGNDSQPDRLYHNEGDGTFTDQTGLIEREGTTEGAGFQAAWFDFDRDGDLDLYLANDYLREVSEFGNRLWRNDGPDPRLGWRFTDVTDASGAGYRMNSMGIAVGDPDGDLDLDLAISNLGSNVLAQNQGDGTFIDVAAEARVDRPMRDAHNLSVTWGLGFADLNLDGWEDLFVAGGLIDIPAPAQPNEVFSNDGAGAFLDLSALSGADDQAVSRGVAFGDYDGDGRIDLFVVTQGGKARLFRNVTPTADHWLEVDLVGRSSNQDGCGAMLQLTASGRSMIRQVLCGSTSLASGSDTPVHFGLGTADVVAELRIDWPSGVVQTLTDLPGDDLREIIEPG